ncbi:TonB-dependent receptor [Deferribacter abyssi]|uniref:TonB-dependent receptor n=1 Tax=Deferribacter abyssi TaxID=213806 RepID=UPI003C1C9F9A
MRLLWLLICFLSFAKSVMAIELEEIKVFDTYLDSGLNDAYANVEVIDYETIKKLKPTDTIDLLNYINGVDIRMYDKKHVSIDMGGFGAENGGLNNVIMVNGVRLNLSDMSNPDLTMIPVENIERIEVYHGGNSVLFGDRAVGGVINIVTKKPLKSGFYTKAEAGSYDMSRFYANGSYATESMFFTLSGDKFYTDSYRNNSELKIGSSSFETGYFGEKFEINIFGIYTDSTYGLPGGLSLDDIDKYGREYSRFPNDGGHDFEYIYGGKLKIYLPFGEFTIKTDYRDRHRDYTFWSSDYTDDLKYFDFRPMLNINVNKGDYKNQLKIGFDYDNYLVKNQSSWNNSTLRRRMFGYYFYDVVEILNFRLEGGYRYQRLKDNNKILGLKQTYNVEAFDIVLSYLFNKKHRFYIKYDKSFRFPTTDEKFEWSGYNSLVEPQINKTYELGIKGNFSKRIYYGLRGCYQNSGDQILYDDTIWHNINMDTKRQGVTANLGYNDKKFILDIKYSYTKAEIDEGDNKGNELPLLPKYQLKSIIGYKFDLGVGIYFMSKYYSKMYMGSDFDNSNDRLDDYWIHDLKVDYTQTFKIGEISVYGKINNIFNKKYYDFAYVGSYYPAPERNYMVGLSYKF